MNRTKTVDSAFRMQMYKLLIPLVVQNLLNAAVSSSDVIMLNYVGQSSISAVSLAANYAQVLGSVFYGLGTGATLLCAQYYGKKDYRAIGAVQGIALRFSVAISVLFALAAFTAPQLLMRLFTNDAELISIGAGYLRIMGITYLCWGIIEVYMAVLRSIGRVTVCLVLNIMTFFLNILLNAVFIFGLFGAPKLGAVGVAIATAASRVVELVGSFVVSALSRDVKLDLSEMLRRNKVLTGDFVRLALPALGNDVSWGVAFSMYSVILGHLGNDAVAANSIVVVIRNLTTTFCFAVAGAGGILLGNVMGTGDLDKAKKYASEVMKMTVLTGAAGGVILIASMPLVLRFASASLSETAMGYLRVMLWINSYYIMGAAVNTSLIAGVFRAGGDTRFGLICDSIDMWCYAVPLGFLAAFVLKLPVLWVYFLLCTDEFVKWPWVIRHYRSGAWAKNITREGLFGESENVIP